MVMLPGTKDVRQGADLHLQAPATLGQLRTTGPHGIVTQLWHLKLCPGILQNSLAEPSHTGDKSSKQRGNRGLTEGEPVTCLR